MAGPQDPAGLDLEARFARAFQELLELTWAEHQALVDQLEQVLSMERQLMEIGRAVQGRRTGRLGAPAPSQGDAVAETRAPEEDRGTPMQGAAAPEISEGPRDDPTLTDLPGVGKIRAKALEDAGYDLARIAEAGPEALMEVRGIGGSVAKELIEAARELHGKGA